MKLKAASDIIIIIIIVKGHNIFQRKSKTAERAHFSFILRWEATNNQKLIRSKIKLKDDTTLHNKVKYLAN